MTDENKGNTDKQRQDLTADFDGEVYEFKSVEQKDKFIASRDAAKSAVKTLKDQTAAVEAKAKKAEERAAAEARRAEAAELTKKDELEKAEQVLAKPHIERANALESKLVRSELASVLRSRGDLIESSINDALSLLMADSKFKLDGDSLKTEDGKDVKTTVESFLKDRDYYKVAKTTAGTGANKGKTIENNTKDKSPNQMITDGLKGLKR